MNRAADGQANATFGAPAGSTLDGFAVNCSYIYTNGPCSEARHLAALLKLSIASGEISEVGQMIEALVPDAVFLIGQNLVFNSLAILTGPDLATTDEWAKRQGSYRVGLNETTPTKISEEMINVVAGADTDAKDVYTADGDHRILRISPDGTTTTFVDCTGYTGEGGELLIYELWVDDVAVYLRVDGSPTRYYRFAK
jgi:hypothetical protein